MSDRKILCKRKDTTLTYVVYEIKDYYPDNESGYLFDYNQNVITEGNFNEEYSEIL